MQNSSATNSSKIRFLITGVTGFLGRNLFLEIIKNHYKNLSEIEIIVLGRSSDKDSLLSRVTKILIDDLSSYVNDRHRDSVDFIREVLSVTKCVNMTIGEPKLGISQEDYKILASQKIDFFFHVAAMTDFRDGEVVIKNLEKANIEGTREMINLALELKVGEFDYVSSAYTCGLTAGEIMPDYVNLEQNFRNPYEKTKLKAEILVRNSGLRYKVFRPSTICGRLIENKIGAIPKFDVFYAWGAFFLRHKQKSLGTANYMDLPFNIEARFQASFNSGLNIVPADYAAKVIYYAAISNDDAIDYHLVGNDETPHKFYLLEMLKFMGISGVEMVDEEIKNPTRIENFYSKTVGKIFAPYINFEEIKFNNDSANKVAQKFGFSCPDINENNFAKLMSYAKEKEFGLVEQENISDQLLLTMIFNKSTERKVTLDEALQTNSSSRKFEKFGLQEIKKSLLLSA